jgi:hypothetical protein
MKDKKKVKAVIMAKEKAGEMKKGLPAKPMAKPAKKMKKM